MSRQRRKRSQQNRSVQVVSSQPSVQLLEISEKSNPNYFGMLSYSDTPQAKMMPRNYASYAKDGFTDETIFKCISYIITNGAAIPPKLFTDRNMKKEIEKHPLLDKLARPNPEQSGVFFRKAVLGYFLIAGNSFIYAIRNKNAPPDELWALQPDRVSPMISKTRGITGFKCEDFEDGKNIIPPENMGFLRTWNPQDPALGLSTMSVAALTIDCQSSARKWNLSLLQNKGKMEGAWSTDAILSPNDRSKLEDRVHNKFHGYRNAGRVPVLDGGLKWNPMSVPPAQMDWLDALKYNSGSLANLFNIPPQLIGDTSSTTYDNMEQAKAASYTEEIFPILDEFYDMLNSWLLPMYPDLKNAYLYYDKDSVEVVQAVIQQQKDAQAKRANAAWMQGSCTLNEARAMQDLPPIDGGDVFRFGAILVRSTEIDNYAEQSLQKPAAPPMPVPEPELNVPTPPDENGTPPKKPGSKPPKTDNQQEPPASGKKSADDVEYAQADDPKKWVDPTVDERLADYADRQVTHLRWVCDGDPCDECKENDGQVVLAGDPFNSGDVLPQVHPHCLCGVVEMSAPQFGMMRRRGVHDAKADLTYSDALAQLETSEEPPQDATTTKGLSREEYRRFMSSTLK